MKPDSKGATTSASRALPRDVFVISREGAGRYRIFGPSGPTPFWRTSEAQLRPILRELQLAYEVGRHDERQEQADIRAAAKTMSQVLTENNTLRRALTKANSLAADRLRQIKVLEFEIENPQ